MEKRFEAIKAILIEHLPAELAIENAKYAAYDTVNFVETPELSTPSETSYYLEENMIAAGDYPAINIEFPTEEEDVQRVAKELHGVIEVYVNDLGDGRVQRLIRRYIYAIERILKIHQTLDGACKIIGCGSRYFGKYKDLQDGHFFRVGALEIAIRATY